MQRLRGPCPRGVRLQPYPDRPFSTMTYAIIQVAGKQYRVREGERLLVDRLAHEEGSSFTPTVLLVGGDGPPVLDAGDVKVTAKVVGSAKGPKIRIGKYKKRTGYRRHTGFRASLSQIEIESIGGKGRSAAAKSKPEPKAAAESPKTVEPAPATPSGTPEGYADLTVAAIKAAAGSWSATEVAAALAYEQEHGQRKGAIAALESAQVAQGGER
jgi:large subunit ribosomal protein L21